MSSPDGSRERTAPREEMSEEWAPARALRARGKFYAAPPGQIRVRRATDVVGLAASLLTLTAVIAAQPTGQFERSLLAFLDSFPSWLGPIWAFLIGLLALWSLLLLLVPLLTRRPRITIEAVLAIALAILVGVVAARIATGHWAGSEAVSGLDATLPFPAVRLAAAAALIAVVNAHLSSTFSSTGRWLLGLGGVAAVMDGRTTISGTVAALLAGVAAGAAVRLALGTSAGRP